MADLTAMYEAWTEVGISDGERMGRCAALAAAILSAPLRTPVMSMRLVHGGWEPEAGERPGVETAESYDALKAALGPYDHATLCDDPRGGPVAPGRWCQCAGLLDSSDVAYYERWEARGRVTHGWVHRTCRHLVQAG